MKATPAELLTQVLYPANSHQAGQELRLQAGIFLLRRLAAGHPAAPSQPYPDLTTLPDKVAIQLNDTHPAVAVAELMRLLMDDHGLDFDTAWDITKRTFAYTNHTLLPEALESWPVPLFERLLPRHMQIVYAINAQLLIEVAPRQVDDEQSAAFR